MTAATVLIMRQIIQIIHNKSAFRGEPYRAPLSVFSGHDSDRVKMDDDIVNSQKKGEAAMKKHHLIKDNRGMTLLELIIAVSIFAIAAVVLLQAFVTSGRVNKKSSLYLNASTAAQNVMEVVKGKDFAELSMAFNYPVNPVTKALRLDFLNDQLNQYKNGTLTLKESLKDGSTYKDVRLYRSSDKDTSQVTASVISTDNGKTYTFNPRTKGANQSKYYFQIAGMEVGNQTFDALLTFDGSKDSGYKKKTNTNKELGKNDYEVSNISKLNTESNAFLIMPLNWDENAMKNMVYEQAQRARNLYPEEIPSSAEGGEGPILDVDEVYQHTKRTLYIKIEESGGTVKASAKYTLSAYDYKKKGGKVYENMSICPCNGDRTGTNGCFCTYESAYVPFYSSEAGAELKNLFVFYYPNYNSTSSASPLDEIVFENTDNYPVQFYVAKQRPDATVDEDGTASDDSAATTLPTFQQEEKYRMSLTVKECPAALGQINWNTNPSLYRAQTVLRTNLDYNISNLDDVLNRTSVNQMKLTYQSVTKSGANDKKVTGKSAKQILSVNGLDDKQSEDRIYTATVEIYKAGAAQNNFPESDRLVVLDGAKED